MGTTTVVVCPVYNEQKYLKEFCRRLERWWGEDVVFINDGSTDTSSGILHEFTNRYKKGDAAVIEHPVRQGYGAALIAGFNYALERSYHRVVTIDSDLQHKPEDITRITSALDSSEVVLGSRYLSGRSWEQVPYTRLSINRYISCMIEKTCRVKYTDPFCGLRGYRRSFLEHAHLREKSYGIPLEVLMEIIRLGCSFREVPVEPIYHDRNRKFYDGLNEPLKRLYYYLEVIEQKRREWEHEKKVLSGNSAPR
ncbi:MAG: glycosyltransferase family 2 protein [Spirochaetota bacterium]